VISVELLGVRDLQEVSMKKHIINSGRHSPINYLAFNFLTTTRDKIKKAWKINVKPFQCQLSLKASFYTIIKLRLFNFYLLDTVVLITCHMKFGSL